MCTPLPLTPSSTVASAASAAAKSATGRRPPPKRKAAPAAGKRKKKASSEDAPSSAEPAPTNKGEEELQRQIEMAMLATGAAAGANDAPPRAPPAPPAPPAVPGGAWRRGREANGTPVCWVEVFAESGESTTPHKWLHVDPLYGWIDHPHRVEEAHARGQPLSYVVACMAGGVKDVTKRYCADVRATQRLRDEAWWQETIAPLRVSVSGLTAGGQAGVPAGRHGRQDGGFVKEVGCCERS